MNNHSFFVFLCGMEDLDKKVGDGVRSKTVTVCLQCTCLMFVLIHFVFESVQVSAFNASLY